MQIHFDDVIHFSYALFRSPSSSSSFSLNFSFVCLLSTRPNSSVVAVTPRWIDAIDSMPIECDRWWIEWFLVGIYIYGCIPLEEAHWNSSQRIKTDWKRASEREREAKLGAHNEILMFLHFLSVLLHFHLLLFAHFLLCVPVRMHFISFWKISTYSLGVFVVVCLFDYVRPKFI